MTSLLVVDDHTLFREGMIALIGQWSEFRVVGQAEDGPTAVALAQELQPDIVLLDVNMPGGDGLTAAAKVRLVAPKCAVVMLTVSEDSDDLLEALQAGARGYILKDVPARQLKNYLRDIRDGHSVVSPSMAGVLFNRAGPDDYGAENSDLSERQKQVVRLVAEGDSNYQIARKLGLSENTVKKYVHLIMTKLGAANRAEAAVRAFRDGLLDE